jgi:hypothetical protein
MTKFEAGQEVTLFVKGAGVVSEETHVVDYVDEEGYVYLVDSDRQYDANGKWTDKDTLFGFDFWIK